MPTLNALRTRKREARKAATVTFLVLAATLALLLAGCGFANSDGDGGASDADDGNSQRISDEERSASDPEMLNMLEQLEMNASDLDEDTTDLKNSELKRAVQMKENLEVVEDLGREQIELARTESQTWSSEEDPACEDIVEFPPPSIEDPLLLPPYQYPYKWRGEVGTEPIGVNNEDVSEARNAVANMEQKIEANPDDPLVDESKITIADTEKGISRAEEELAQGEKLQSEITAQEERNEDLYEEWETEHSEELYDDLFC